MVEEWLAPRRGSRGTGDGQFLFGFGGIAIDGHVPQPCIHDQPIRYLGFHVSLGGSWLAQRKKSLGMFSMFARLVNKFGLSLRSAVYMFNVFLLPKLEL